MSEEKQEIIAQEPEILESMPATNGESKGLIPKEEVGGDTRYLSHLDFVSNNVDKFVDAKHKIWSAVLRLAKNGDWVVFGEGEKARACLSGAGADRIASSIGISFTNWTDRKEEGEDDKGKWYRYWFECDASFGGRVIKALGRSGSRDKFFGKAYGKLKELSEIDESNIRMAAFHNTMKEGVKILLGLRNIPVDELEKAGIQLQYANKVSFEKKEEPNKDTSFPTNPSDALTCGKCDAVISEKVHKYSMDKHGKALCYNCQKG